jgi:sulfur-carrier protein adenylyltransferase/sulfurtransferase
MPDKSSPLTARYEAAVAQLRGGLLAELRARRLAAHELATHTGRDYTDGWRIQAEFSDRRRDLDLLVGPELPFVSPAVALADAPPLLTWPHVEEGGVLCLLPNLATVPNRGDAWAIARGLLIDAFGLVEDNIAGRTRDDFLREFLSYWNRDLSEGSPSFLSLVEPRSPSRIVDVWLGADMYVIGEGGVAVQSWLKNRYGRRGGPFKTQPAALLWLDRPLYPEEYPKAARDVWSLAREHAPEGIPFLSTLATSSPEKIVVILGSPTENGPCLAGITVTAPHRLSAGGSLVNPLNDGFRRGRTPPLLVSHRYWQAMSSARRSAVERADPEWVHGRGRDARQAVLAASSVAMIGCGSVGAPVAIMLAMAGVGRILLIDPDILRRANAGRHPLGEKYVGKPKAAGLAEFLKGNYPHLKVEAKVSRWERVARLDPELLLSCGLIVSATGDWGTESGLNEWQRGLVGAPPVVYGWTEAHACAGHAVGIIADGGCLECGFDNSGIPRLQVTAWGRSVHAQEPACGSVYQPYGPVELNHTVTLTGELALDVLLGEVRQSEHRIWSCRRKFLENCGGEWTREWLQLVGGRAEGGFTFSRRWPKAANCAACSRKGVAA